MIGRKARMAIWVSAFAASCAMNANDGQAAQPEAGGLETVAEGLSVPWSIDFLPDGALIITERTGAVKIIENSTIRVAGELDVAATGEAGLLGLALDPDFEANRYCYLYYTRREGGGMLNRVSRFTLRDTLASKMVLIDSIPAASIHDGGRVRFGPDRLLYVTTGDAGVSARAQDVASLAGKILRIDPAGNRAAGNPFANRVYALGIRNCEGIAWHDGVMYAIDHGPRRHDEINIIERGGNYGWPALCTEDPAFRCYPDFTLAPAGLVAVDSLLLVACLRGNQIRRIKLGDGDESALFTNLGRLRAIALRDDYLYFGTSNRDGRGDPGPEDDRILRTPLSALTP